MVSIGAAAGRRVRDVVKGEEVAKIARRSGKGPAQGRLLKAYARSLQASQELFAASQAAHVFTGEWQPRGDAAGGGTGSPYMSGGTGETDEAPRSRCCRWPTCGCPRFPRPKKACERLGLFLNRSVKFVKWMFPITTWVKFVFARRHAQILSVLPVTTVLILGLLASPQLVGGAVAQMGIWFAFGLVQGILQAVIAGGSYFSESVGRWAEETNLRMEDLAADNFGENGEVVLEGMYQNVVPCSIAILFWAANRGAAGGPGQGVVAIPPPPL